jgi:dihydroxyacetone kinase-like protein
MQALQEGVAEAADLPPHQQLARLGMMFNSSAASTFGALVATAAMRAGKAAQNAGDEWDLAALAAMARAAEQGVSERGKAVRGQKTLLDALGPAVDALEEASERGATLAEAAQEAARAAEEGAEATSPLQAQIGRAGWLQERTVGIRDPGAHVVALAARAVAQQISD